MNLIGKETLYELYAIKEKPMHEIAKELGVSVGAVYNYMKKYGIMSRTSKENFEILREKGWKYPESARRKIGDINRGKIVSEETKRKMSISDKDGGIGHKKKRKDGYIYIYFPDHPKSTKDGYIMEHVLVMECLIGRHLNDDEVVHHKNKIRYDNRKENLQLMTKREHASYHMKERHKKEGR